ncbi:hypothetical protein KC352_g26590, partial [Hortaea werneckii]
MSYTPVSGQIYSPQPQQPPHHFYSATPPPPPPKPSGSSTPARGPPLPPPPPGAPQQSGPSELDGNQGQGTQQQPALPSIPTIDSNWLPAGPPPHEPANCVLGGELTARLNRLHGSLKSVYQSLC